MLKANSWFVGLIIMSAVIGLIFGGVYWLIPADDTVSPPPILEQANVSDNPDTIDTERADNDRPEEHHDEASLGAGILITALNLVKIAIVILIVTQAIPRLGALSQRYRPKTP